MLGDTIRSEHVVDVVLSVLFLRSRMIGCPIAVDDKLWHPVSVRTIFKGACFDVQGPSLLADRTRR